MPPKENLRANSWRSNNYRECILWVTQLIQRFSTEISRSPAHFCCCLLSSIFLAMPGKLVLLTGYLPEYPVNNWGWRYKSYKWPLYDLNSTWEKQRTESVRLLLCPCTTQLPIPLILLTKLNCLHTELTNSSDQARHEGWVCWESCLLAPGLGTYINFQALEWNSLGSNMFNSATQNHVPLWLLRVCEPFNSLTVPLINFRVLALFAGIFMTVAS